MAPKVRDVRTRNCATISINLTIVPDDELPREDDVMLHGDKGDSSVGRGLRSGVCGDDGGEEGTEDGGEEDGTEEGGEEDCTEHDGEEDEVSAEQ